MSLQSIKLVKDVIHRARTLRRAVAEHAAHEDGGRG
jgi:hypothetical protein